LARITMSIVVEDEDYEQVERLAKSLGFTKSQIVRIALRYMFKTGIYQALRTLENPTQDY